MKAKSSAYYQREFRRRLREQGLVKKEVWIRPENAKQLSAVEKALREVIDVSTWKIGERAMTEAKRWTTTSLYEALQTTDLFAPGQASIELIDGVEPALHIVMKEFGDLPIFVTVSGDQIIVEAVLWPLVDVADSAGFNEAILRTHKYFPLSTISLDTLGENADYYQMFGALSASSILSNVVFEIETLASNVIQATEAYSDYLVAPIEAES